MGAESGAADGPRRTTACGPSSGERDAPSPGLGKTLEGPGGWVVPSTDGCLVSLQSTCARGGSGPCKALKTLEPSKSPNPLPSSATVMIKVFKMLLAMGIAGSPSLDRVSSILRSRGSWSPSARTVDGLGGIKKNGAYRGCQQDVGSSSPCLPAAWSASRGSSLAPLPWLVAASVSFPWRGVTGTRRTGARPHSLAQAAGCGGPPWGSGPRRGRQARSRLVREVAAGPGPRHSVVRLLSGWRPERRQGAGLRLSRLRGFPTPLWSWLRGWDLPRMGRHHVQP